MRQVIHWAVAFPPGKGLFPLDPKKEGEVELDTETSLVDTWKAMINLPKSKVRIAQLMCSAALTESLGPGHWCF